MNGCSFFTPYWEALNLLLEAFCSYSFRLNTATSTQNYLSERIAMLSLGKKLLEKNDEGALQRTCKGLLDHRS